MVMYADELVEDQTGRGDDAEQLHPYTQGLLDSYADPRASEISVDRVPGQPPDLSRSQVGCRFTARRPVAVDDCATQQPLLLPGRSRCGAVLAGGTRRLVSLSMPAARGASSQYGMKRLLVRLCCRFER